MRFLLITVKIALRALRRNAMRSLLTVLGIIIGVAAVIAMVSISQGASASVQEKIASLGNNMLVILSGSITQGGVRMGLGARPTLTVGDKGRSAGMSGCGCGDVHQASRPAGCGREPELEHDGHRGLLASVASVSLLVGG